MSSSSTWVQVTWSPVFSNISLATILYNVTATTLEGVVISQTQVNSSTSAILTDLLTNTRYRITVIALTRVGSVEMTSAPSIDFAITATSKLRLEFASSEDKYLKVQLFLVWNVNF